MKILIIGGSRFVGPLLVKELLKKKHDVTVFNRGRIKSNYENIKFIQGDRNDVNIKDKFKNEFFDVLIDTCAFRGAQIKKAINEFKFDFYLNFSTAAVYKKTNRFPLTEESEVGDWPFWGDYNKGKVECENVLKEEGVEHANIRPVYVLGQNNYINREKFIYDKIKHGSQLILPGDGEAKIQFVFAEDVANAMVLLAEKKLQGNFNCCQDEKEALTLNEFVNIMADVVRYGKELKIEYNPKLDGKMPSVNDFPFANETFYCSNNKVKKKLKIEFTQLFEGLKKDYQGYYKNVI